jgi:beta-galactosidase
MTYRYTRQIFIAVSLLFVLNFSVNAQTATLESTLTLQDVGGIKVPYQNGMPLPTFEKQSTRQIINLAGEWKKQRFAASDNISLSKRDASGISTLESEATGRQLTNFNDAGWEKKILPGVENALTEAAAPNGLYPEIYNDGIWYRKTFSIDAASNGKFVKLMFYSINYVCDVWINNKYVGYHEGGYTPFAFDVSSLLNYGSVNTIAVRVDNLAWGARKDIIPFNQVDWFNYAGVVHDVYLEVSDAVSTTRANIVTKDVDGSLDATLVLNNKKNSLANINATIKIYEASVTSNNIQSEYARDLVGNEVAVVGESQKSVSLIANGATAWKINLKIVSPKLWSMKNPNLYIMKVTLTDGSTILDDYYTQFGIRSISTKNGKFLLNNKITLLTGVARHEEHPDYGRSLPKEIIYSDLVTVKNLNAVYLRSGHYPNHLYTYLIADRLGIAIMEEIPLWQWDTQDVWDIQNLNRKIHQQMFREMVFKDYNRPSILMWSTSNECHLNGGGRLVYHNLIKDDLRNNFNDGRMLTQSAAADNPGATDLSQSMLDIAGWTIYFGIFYGRSGSYLGPTFSFVNDAKAAFPTKPILDTEFGYWSSETGSSQSEQVNVLNQTFNAFKYNFPYDASGALNSEGNLMGTTWWCVFDWYQYKAKANGWQTMGLISMDRKTEKPVAGELRSLYLPYSSMDGIAVGIKNDSREIPFQFRLEQNYPNPFNPSTVINYQIPTPEKVSLKIYDLLGKEVTTLVNENKPAGKYSADFSTHNLRLTSGVYFYKLSAGQFSQTRKMLILK